MWLNSIANTVLEFYHFFTIKKTCRYISTGLFVFSLRKQKAKGEEKPEEELMGKCKSSPSLKQLI